MSTKQWSRLDSAVPLVALFGKTRAIVLCILFYSPQRQFFMREIITAAETGNGAIQRQLNALEKQRLVLRTRAAGRVFYQANGSAPVFAEIRSAVTKTVKEYLLEAVCQPQQS